MGKALNSDWIGKRNISAHLSSCAGCGKLVLLSSYTTTRFVKFMALPLAPTRKFHVIDECPVCGHRGVTTRRHHARERKKNLAIMMEGFTTDPDDPDNCLNALHTLMIYNEEAWFKDVRKTYGLRFETDPRIQLQIARGFCRFGDYEQAIEQCDKAAELGEEEKAEELRQFCLSAIVAKKYSLDLEQWVVKEESSKKAYIPLTSFASALLLLVVYQGVSALRTNRAWIVNGALRPYEFVLDGEAHVLPAGERRQIKLKLGEHELRVEDREASIFSYDIPLVKQLLQKQLLVINPDTLAFLRVESADGSGARYSQGSVTHALSGVGYPLFSFRKEEADRESGRRISMFRPKTHMEMVEHMRSLDKPGLARGYARRALIFSPQTDEAEPLLHVALEGASAEFQKSFTRDGLALEPTSLAWHLYYQESARLNGFSDDLIPEYTARCKERPNEPESFYLLGRVLTKRELAHQFFLRSEEGIGMGGLGFYSIAADCFAHGEIDPALQHIVSALTAAPGNHAFNDLRERILLAKRDYDALLETAELDETPRSAERRTLYLTLAGYHQEAEKLAATFDEGALAASLNAIRFHAVGNVKSYLASIESAGDPGARVKRLIFERRAVEADAEMSETGGHAWWEHLEMYCEAMAERQPEIAERNLEKAAEEMKRDDFTHLKISRLLTTDEAPAAERVVELEIEPTNTALLCAVLSYRFPERGEEFKALSRRYNFTPVYPSLLIKRWTTPTARP